MEKNDLAMMKAENERLATDLERLKQRLREEITRTQAGVRLDLNLEKGSFCPVLLFCFVSCFVFSFTPYLLCRLSSIRTFLLRKYMFCCVV